VNGIASLFLRARAWQLFLLIILLGGTTLWSSNVSDPSASYFHRLLALGLDPLLFFAWAWFAGMFLSSILVPGARFDKPFFIFSAVYSVVYFASYPFVLSQRPSTPLWFTVVTLGFGMICAINIINAVATSLRSAETGETPKFSDAVLYFEAIWAFPIGVWFVQPKINRLYAEAASHRSV
jgi:hypothetical protein